MVRLSAGVALLCLLAGSSVAQPQGDAAQRIHELLQQLSAEDLHYAQQIGVMTELRQFGPQAIEAVPRLKELAAVEGSVGCYANAAIYTITEDTEDVDVEMLLDCLGDSFGGARFSAADTLGQIGPRVLPQLLEALESEQVAVRSYGAAAIRNMGPSACPTLQTLLDKAAHDPEADVRGSAALALGAILGPTVDESRQLLRKMTHETDEYVAEEAGEALQALQAGRVGVEPAPAAQASLLSVPSAVGGLLLGLVLGLAVGSRRRRVSGTAE
jgi:HEAT repeat protein